MSEFHNFPHQDFVKSLDPAWVTDMQMTLKNYNFQHNKHPAMQMFDELMTRRKNGDGNNNWASAFSRPE